jgi:prophage regulatory protein
MTPTSDLPRLVGTPEIREMLGVHRSRVAQLVNTKGFPDPVARSGRRNLWLAADVEAWAKAAGRELHDYDEE